MTPHNFDAEHGLLGILLFDPQSFRRVEGRLKAIDFYEPAHGAIYAAVMAMHQDRVPFSTAGVRERLKSHDGFMELGGDAFLRDLADHAPDASMAEGFADVIADLSVKRQILRLSERMARDAKVSPDSAEKLIADGESGLNIIARGADVADAWSGGEALTRAANDTLEGLGKAAYTPTGLRAFDRSVGGWVRGRTNILAGRPSMGKSALACSIGLSMARMGLGVAINSLEMDKGELANRLACAAAYRDDGTDNPMYFLANKGELSDAARLNMAYGAQELRDLPLYFDDRAGMKPSQIIANAKRLLRRWEKAGITPGCFIVDHLTIVRPDNPTGNKVVDIGDISGAFRDAARDMDVAFVLLCQLSRAVDSRDNKDKRPDLPDLRWSGEIEQDVAQATFIFRPEKYLKEPAGTNYSSDEWLTYADEKARWANRVLLLNRKNRGGPTQVDTEYGINLGCNAMWEVES